MDRSSVHVVCPHCGAVNRIPPERPAKEAKCGRCHRAIFEGKPISVTTEGFERHRYDDILGLQVRGLTASVIAALGYRKADDKYATAPKVRFPREEVVLHI